MVWRLGFSHLQVKQAAFCAGILLGKPQMSAMERKVQVDEPSPLPMGWRMEISPSTKRGCTQTSIAHVVFPSEAPGLLLLGIIELLQCL